ncbi:thiamine pyrophosphate-dependent enzyme [Desulfobacterales bacterium HSG17]|nr:thiamine pyrophosphate-dependent enzyme [Desulfobacterales bacterium HSG17]
MIQSEFDIDNENQWCPGCGNFSILKSMKDAFTALDFTPRDLLLVSGIGQAGKTPNYLACNMLHGLHGRALALATGAKIANHNLNIIVNSGDGDCYGEGGNHFMAAIRRNIDITLLIHNNQVYGLTKGQASPTSDFGMKTKNQNHGTTSNAFNPVATALVMGAGFIARGFSGNIQQLTHLIVEAVNYKGFSMIDIYQPCVSFNKINTHSWYKSRVFDLKDTNHDYSDYEKALPIVHNQKDEIPTGIIYKKYGIPFHERVDVLKERPLIEHSFKKNQLKEILCIA